MPGAIAHWMEKDYDVSKLVSYPFGIMWFIIPVIRLIPKWNKNVKKEWWYESYKWATSFQQQQKTLDTSSTYFLKLNSNITSCLPPAPRRTQVLILVLPCVMYSWESYLTSLRFSFFIHSFIQWINQCLLCVRHSSEHSNKSVEEKE